MIINDQMSEMADRLSKEFGTDHVVVLQEIYQIFRSEYNRPEGSVLPSDYSYNRINNGIQLCKPAVFEFFHTSCSF